MADHVTEYAINTAEEFVEALSPTGRIFGPTDRNDFVPPTNLFRGHADARWSLLPSALRRTRDNIEAARRAGNAAAPPVTLVQATVERNTLSAFFQVADRQGLALPEDSRELRNALQKVAMPWPPEPFWSVLALVQHHGLPTRLLDWSRSAYAAAYFAAVDATRWVVGRKQPPAGATHLAVWAITDPYVKLGVELFIRQKQPAGRAVGELKIVTAPEYGNPNLHAQLGMFTLYNEPNPDPNADVDLRPLDEIVRDEFQIRGVLEKLTLPINEAPRLLTLLARHNVNGAALFPGYDGVVKFVDEMIMWEEFAANV